mmetsp:Transcript_105644/g.251908  ORF Transcript_105644/g.251908 Transcript_105644/m.251908 type:complete len:247 (+) Transcript_105644:3086-3826(+)
MQRRHQGSRRVSCGGGPGLCLLRLGRLGLLRRHLWRRPALPHPRGQGRGGAGGQALRGRHPRDGDLQRGGVVRCSSGLRHLSLEHVVSVLCLLRPGSLRAREEGSAGRPAGGPRLQRGALGGARLHGGLHQFHLWRRCGLPVGTLGRLVRVQGGGILRPGLPLEVPQHCSATEGLRGQVRPSATRGGGVGFELREELHALRGLRGCRVERVVQLGLVQCHLRPRRHTQTLPAREGRGEPLRLPRAR